MGRFYALYSDFCDPCYSDLPPSFWVRHVMSKHGRELVGLPGTGGELARHLIKRFELGGIKVEETEPFRDCFDPQD